MKVSREKAAENRARIVAAASRLFRERGFSGVGVDALTEAAGLTHGGLYSQFRSKEALAAEALAQALADSARRRPAAAADETKAQALTRLVAGYLSARHRDAPGEGCALAALGSDTARQTPQVRAAFTQGVRSLEQRLAGALEKGEPLSVMATMVGGLMLARAVEDPELSERILAACRGAILEGSAKEEETQAPDPTHQGRPAPGA